VGSKLQMALFPIVGLTILYIFERGGIHSIQGNLKVCKLQKQIVCLEAT
jgi:hypothetical protein